MQHQHAMFPTPDREEASLLDFAVSFKQRLSGPVTERVRERCDGRLEPHLRTAGPEAWREVAARLDDDPAVRFWSALKRTHQEFYVDVTAGCVDRQLPALVGRYREIASGETLGSLELDPAVEVPSYQAGVDIHCVPGGYALERTEDDVYPGARSDLGGAVFAMRRHGALHEDKGATGAREVRERFPALKPKRILDLGCTAGNSTLPWVDAFPEAEVHAIDVAAPCLRYAHARAESLGRRVFFSQQNAERTRFPDAHFDLIVSHILLHETSRQGLAAILAECRRLLRPGGVMMHVEVPVRRDGAVDQYFMNWDARYNNEPFWATLAALDFPSLAAEAGFDAAEVFVDRVPSTTGKPDGWMVMGGRKTGADAQ